MEVGTVGGGSGSGRQDCAHVGPVLEMTVGDTVVARRVAMTPLQANGGGRGAVQPLVGSFKFQILNGSVKFLDILQSPWQQITYNFGQKCMHYKI